jgi:hypothetical protein
MVICPVQFSSLFFAFALPNHLNKAWETSNVTNLGKILEDLRKNFSFLVFPTSFPNLCICLNLNLTLGLW